MGGYNSLRMYSTGLKITQGREVNPNTDKSKPFSRGEIIVSSPGAKKGKRKGQRKKRIPVSKGQGRKRSPDTQASIKVVRFG